MSAEFTSRGAHVSGEFFYFVSKTLESKTQIVRVNLDTFNETVLGLSDKIGDFLVDENQTITYLTSQGELIQENVENSSSTNRTCVNLKANSPDAIKFHTLCRTSPRHILATSLLESMKGNRFILCSNFEVTCYQVFQLNAELKPESSLYLESANFGVAQATVRVIHGVSFVLCRLYSRFIQLLSVFGDFNIRLVQTLDIAK